MDKEEVLALIKEQLEASNKVLEGILQQVSNKLVEDIHAYVDETVSPLMDLKEPKGETQAPQDPKGDSLDPNAARVAQLEKTLADFQEKLKAKEEAESSLRFQSALSGALDKFNPKFKDRLLKQLQGEYQGQVKQDGDRWLLGDGKTLDEAVTEFFSSDYGKHHLPADYRDGAGSKQPEKSRQTPQPDLNDLIRQTFS